MTDRLDMHISHGKKVGMKSFSGRALTEGVLGWMTQSSAHVLPDN